LATSPPNETNEHAPSSILTCRQRRRQLHPALKCSAGARTLIESGSARTGASDVFDCLDVAGGGCARHAIGW